MGRRTHTRYIEVAVEYTFRSSIHGQPKVPFTKCGWKAQKLGCPYSFLEVLESINWDEIMGETAWKPGSYILGGV